jgi:hypothetical protein
VELRQVELHRVDRAGDAHAEEGVRACPHGLIVGQMVVTPGDAVAATLISRVKPMSPI